MLYRNNTDTLVVISDLNIEFKRRGEYGDHVNLSNFASPQAIQNSQDLKIALRERWLVAAIPATATKAAGQRRNIGGKTTVEKIKEDQIVAKQNFAVYEKANQPQSKEGAVVYSPTDRKVLAVDKIAPKVTQPAPVTVVAEPLVPDTVVASSPPETVTVTAASEEVEQPSQQSEVSETANEVVPTEPTDAPEAPEAPNEAYCIYIKKTDNKQCKRRRQKDSEYCPAHDPE